MKESYFSLRSGDEVRVLVTKFGGRVPVGARGRVLEIDNRIKHALIGFNVDGKKVNGWVKRSELKKVIRKGRKKKGLDEFAKSYWKRYLEETGLDEQMLRLAFDKVEELMGKEDELSPIEMRRRYKELAKEYEDVGGLNFIRRIRLDSLRRKWQKDSIGSVVIHRSRDSDKTAYDRGLRSCYHILGKDVGIFHIRDKRLLKEKKSEFDGYEADYLLPEDWEE